MRTSAHHLRADFALLILATSLFVGACGPGVSATLQPPAATSPSLVTPATGYPGPGETPAATVPPFPTGENPLVTPPASETVQTGPITSAANPQDSLPYRWRTQQAKLAAGQTIRLFVQYQGQEIQLGNDSGVAQFWSSSPQYLAWSFEDTGLPLSFTPGLYVRVVATGKDVLVAPGQRVGFAHVDGDWVVYINWESPTKAPANTAYDAPRATAPLIGYNLVTGQSFTVSTGIPDVPGRGAMTYFGVSGNVAGWIEYDLQRQTYAIKLEDLKSGVVQALNVQLQKPVFFSVSQNLVVWRDTYWHGYSLDRNAAFTIPYAPKEWENKAGIMVVARDSAVEWDIPVSDTAYQYYTAPVINK